MTLKRTTWGPDTCQCRVTYEWDDAVDSVLRIHTMVGLENKCPFHAVVMDSSLYQTVLDENRRKNLTFDIARVERGLPLPVEGEPYDTSWYKWAFTPGRVLEVSFSVSVPQNIKTRIQNLCDLQFGPGKVLIK